MVQMVLLFQLHANWPGPVAKWNFWTLYFVNQIVSLWLIIETHIDVSLWLKRLSSECQSHLVRVDWWLLLFPWRASVYQCLLCGMISNSSGFIQVHVNTGFILFYSQSIGWPSVPHILQSVQFITIRFYNILLEKLKYCMFDGIKYQKHCYCSFYIFGLFQSGQAVPKSLICPLPWRRKMTYFVLLKLNFRQ